MTEAELVEMEALFQKESALNPMGAMGLKLIADLRLWNARAHGALKDGLALAGGISDAAMMLEKAGIKIMAERDVYGKALEDIRRIMSFSDSQSRTGQAWDIADAALRAVALRKEQKEQKEPREPQ
jgi:hypothetical protein